MGAPGVTTLQKPSRFLMKLSVYLIEVNIPMTSYRGLIGRTSRAVTGRYVRLMRVVMMEAWRG